MNADSSNNTEFLLPWLRRICVALVLLSVAWRAYHYDAPVVDGFWDKQIAVANKSRVMAGPPFQWLEGGFDFLSYEGESRPLAEEVPLYHVLTAVGYRWFGDRQDWFARGLSSLGSVVALVAFFALVRREMGRNFAWLATVALGWSPMFLFYGRSVLPDVWMMACALAAAAAYRRYFDDSCARWLWLATGLGLLSASFKYYGLIVLLPMAEMIVRFDGWRGLFRPRFWLPAVGMTLPIVVWLALAFIDRDNPARGGLYFIFQEPSLLVRRIFWSRLFERFLWKSCGPVNTVLILVGVMSAVARRAVPRAALAWGITGLAYYIALGPKSWNHEYYELMLLPGAALWAAVGWRFVWSEGLAWSWTSTLAERWPRALRPRAWHGAVALVVLAAVQSPLVSDKRWEQEAGFVIVGGKLEQLCSPQGRVLAGPTTPQPIVHYAHRQGWTWHESFGADWQWELDHYRQRGAEVMAIYFDHKHTAAQRAEYAPLIANLPLIEHAQGPWGKGGRPCEYYILSLRNAPGELESPSADSTTRAAQSGLGATAAELGRLR
ncbi:MAG: glycosyltransferase family 39 protein [Planctomycetes bacterium]|nr:glycosyltransferase family 39 protein [Planctomycetota bacterium]